MEYQELYEFSDRQTSNHWTLCVFRSVDEQSSDVVCFHAQRDLSRAAQYREIPPCEDSPGEHESWLSNVYKPFRKSLTKVLPFRSILAVVWPPVNGKYITAGSETLPVNLKAKYTW